MPEMFMYKKEDWPNAEKMYMKAVEIDPERETAYRYSATPLMKQKKYDEARDRYIEAFITEPYSEYSPRGINQWAQITGSGLGEPSIKIPATAPAAVPPSPWKAYHDTRAEWKATKFAKAFPSEKAYRHTLKEETEALRVALAEAKNQKMHDASLDTLAKIDAEGLLEAYVLISAPDEGIAQDHREYWRSNRPLLRKYVRNYMIRPLSSGTTN